MFRRKSIIIICLLLIFHWFADYGRAQQYGRNRVQYETKNWEYIQSEHFNIYYYQGGKQLANFVACTAESAYAALSKHFNYRLVDRIPFLVYRSHNDFSETNVSFQVVEESVGGFTEFMKDRVIIPFEGSYEKFRHVIHHELTHAVMLQMLYGTGPGAIIRGVAKMQPPLWFTEGLAEFESLGWDTESDMYVRDATLRGYLPPIPYLQAFMAYKGGQSVLRYIQDTRGPQKIGELLHRMQHTRNFEKAWEQAMNEPLEETSKKWQRYMRQKYWPEIANRKEPSDYAEQITDHVKWQNFVNNSPALSPTGDRVAFLTDRSGYFDIYVTSATEPEKFTRLVAGQRKENLEELHWLQPGMSWSPDGKYIVFAARAGKEDALNIIDVDRKKITRTFKFGLDGIFSPAWSPVANEIAFVGMKHQQSDIYIYNLDARELRRVTDDIFSDLEPAWSPDGKDLLFVSDRKENVEPKALRDAIDMVSFDYRTTDIYLVHKDGAGMRRITTSSQNERSPVWSADGKYILYVSDKSGIANIYYLNPETGEERALTDLLTGCAQLSWGLNSDRLAFTAFSNGGYDIYVWHDPFDFEQQPAQPEMTTFMRQLTAGQRYPEIPGSDSEANLVVRQISKARDFSHFVFDDRFRFGKVPTIAVDTTSIELPAEQYREPGGGFKSHKYKTKFGVDYVGINTGYDPIYGVQGMTEIYLSDVLGDNQLMLGANFIQDVLNSDFQFGYLNQKRRLNWSVSAYQFVYFYSTNLGIVRFANRGLGLQMSYPISRFRRLDFGVQYNHIAQNNMTYSFLPSYGLKLLMPQLSYTKDNSIFGYTGPASGDRFYVGITGSPRLGSNGKQFVTVDFDLRKYWAFSREFSLALRLAGGASFGKNPTLFIMGGMDNWLNYRYYEKIRSTSINDYFLSNFLTPLRGADYYEMVGSRAVLMNLELRVPLIQYFVMRLPLPMALQNIRGVVFWDAGSAWSENESIKILTKNSHDHWYLRDVATGFGYGVRVNLGFFLLRLDAAWRTDLIKFSKPRYYFSIGTDF